MYVALATGLRSCVTRRRGSVFLLTLTWLLFVSFSIAETHAASDTASIDAQALRSRAIEILKSSLKDNKSFAKAKKDIVAIGVPAEQALISRLAAKNPKERANAICFLAAIKSEKSIPYFLAKKRDKNHEVRMAALEALDSAGDSELIDKIAESYLHDTHPSVRDMAVIVLGNRKDSRALKHLDEALSDTDEFARECARKGFEKFSETRTEGETEEEKNLFWKNWYAKWLEEEKKREAAVEDGDVSNISPEKKEEAEE